MGSHQMLHLVGVALPTLLIFLRIGMSIMVVDGGNFMKNTTPDPAKPMGEVTIVNDFLPSPEELVPKKNTVRVTMEFTRESSEAERHNASYQAMIRNLVDAYAKQQQDS